MLQRHQELRLLKKKKSKTEAEVNLNSSYNSEDIIVIILQTRECVKNLNRSFKIPDIDSLTAVLFNYISHWILIYSLYKSTDTVGFKKFGGDSCNLLSNLFVILH